MSEDIEQYLETIKQLIPISDLSPSAQNDVMGNAEILEFKKKKFVFKEGDKDNYSYYILVGELELIANHHVHNTMVGGAENARYALSQLQPRQFSAKAKTPVTILRLDKGALDRLIVHEGNKELEMDDSGVEMDVSHIEEEDSGDWMTRMLQSELFARLPMANIQQLFAYLDPVAFEAGDTVIKQGDPGDNYYIIQEGVCEVTRVPKEGENPIKLAELAVGDSFGEESLLTNATRNATITMLTDGILMQLNKDSFVDLIKKPSLSSVSFANAGKIVEEGGEWIDVRFAKEYEASHIEASTNIPLNVIRIQIDKFNHDTHYVVYCDTGGRSSAAAFLLTKNGFHVSYLEGGLNSNPEAASDQIKTEAIAQPAAQRTEQAEPAEEIVEEEKIDAAVKASVLETDLAKNKMELEAADKKQQEKSEHADIKQREELEEAKKKLEQEKIELEKQKKLAEEELGKTREQETVKIEKSKRDAELRMQEEKEKLEAIYSKNTEEMKKLQEMKARAEEQIKKAREQLEKQASESRRELDEARSLKVSVEEAKKKIEEDAEQQRLKQAELEKSVKAKAKALLEQERRKLADKIAQNNEELEQAHKEKAVAEAGRVAAKEEAEKIIEEYKAQFEKEKAELEASLKAERAKLEEESQQIKDKLDEVHKAKDAAETARKAAEKDAEKLKARQAKQVAKGGAEDTALGDEMRRAEEKLAEAKRLLDDAQHEEKITEAAKEENEEEILKQKEEEERLRKQMEAELNEWKEEESERQEQFEGKESQAEHVRRIKERAEAARKETEESADSLFADIASQISSDDHHKLR
jgi:CRP-like cAMP-binding protein